MLYEKILYTAAGIALFFALLVGPAVLTCFNADFYAKGFEKYGGRKAAELSPEDAKNVGEQIASFLNGKSGGLNADVSINGVSRPFFNERELAHMVDVRNLVRGCAVFCVVCLGLVCAAFGCALKRQSLAAMRVCVLLSLTVSFAVFLILCALTALNFNSAFNLFHKIFFNNDLWLLNPQTDLLIALMPLEFFIGAAKAQAAGSAAYFSFVSALLLFYKKGARA